MCVIGDFEYIIVRCVVGIWDVMLDFRSVSLRCLFVIWDFRSVILQCVFVIWDFESVILLCVFVIWDVRNVILYVGMRGQGHLESSGGISGSSGVIWLSKARLYCKLQG